MEMSRFQEASHALGTFYRRRVLPLYRSSLGRARVKTQEVVVKDFQEVASKLDFRIEGQHKRFFKRHFPKHLVIGEESSTSWPPPPGKPYWVVDPIDGTLNSLAGFPVYGSLCALVENDVVEMACIFLPVKEIVYHNGFIVAGRGCGAWEVGKDKTERLTVSKKRRLRDAVLEFEGPSRVMSRSPFVRSLQSLVRSRMGMSCAAAAYVVASGDHRPVSCDAMITIESKPWDTLAPALIIEEAGGRVTGLDGSAWSVSNYASLICSNGLIHDELLAEYRRVMGL